MFDEFISSIDPQVVDVTVRLLVAAVLSGAIGLERQRRQKDGGMRTFAMVGIGSALFTFLSIEAFDAADTSRVAAQIVTGIGFLGAGLIFRHGPLIRGLTTAAGLWAVAAVGMAAGAGMLGVATVSTVVIIVSLFLFRFISSKLQIHAVHKAPVTVTAEMTDAKSVAKLQDLVDTMVPSAARPSAEAGHWSVVASDAREDGAVTLTLRLSESQSEQVVPLLESNRNVTAVNVDSPDSPSTYDAEKGDGNGDAFVED